MDHPQGPRVCFDRIIPSELHRDQPVERSAGRPRAVAPKQKQWVNGSTIHIRFLEGTPEQKRQVEEVAPAWTKHANLKFVFTSDSAAEIRVAFDPTGGAWSYVGIDNLTISRSQPTLNLG